MSYKPCTYNCEGCEVHLTNEHHIYKQETARELGGITLEFCHLPQNTVQICMPMHETLEALYGWPEYPLFSAMKEAIEANKPSSLLLVRPEV